MKKQILSAFAVVTAISIVVITPTTALADDIKYSQSIYEKIGMDRSEIVSWVQDSRQNVYGRTEDEVMQYLIASAEEERSSNIQTDNAITRGSWSNQWFSRGVWIARDGSGRYLCNLLGGLLQPLQRAIIMLNRHGQRFLHNLVRVAIGQPIRLHQK
jgi:hypothetical protein